MNDAATIEPGVGFGESIKFFADRQRDPSNRTGLQFQHVTSRSHRPTLTIEVAPLVPESSRAEWSQKISIQLTADELTAFCEVLFGLKEQIKGNFHGTANNKGFACYCNGHLGVGISVSERGNVLNHVLTPSQRTEVAVFALRQLSTAWKITPSDAIAVLRQMTVINRRS